MEQTDLISEVDNVAPPFRSWSPKRIDRRCEKQFRILRLQALDEEDGEEKEEEKAKSDSTDRDHSDVLKPKSDISDHCMKF
jgi:hypothetical protein